jgi:hypothetical protein
MLSTVSAGRSLGRFLQARRDCSAGKLSSLLGCKSFHALLAADFATPGPLFHKKVTNILW